METAMNMFESNWLAGVGKGNYFLEANQYIPQELRGTWVYTVHNEYLLHLAETGIIGFALYYLILLLAIKKLWFGTRSSNPWVVALSLGFFAALIASFPNRFFSMYQFISTFLLYCVILALAHRMEAMAREA
jgi:O-antigen ligase